MVEGELAKLKTLLGHWIEHNKEHGQEFREWGERANALGETGAGQDMLAAAGEMGRANESLSRALERLAGK